MAKTMPYKDPAKRRAANRRLRENSTPQYHKWLYDRRKLRFETASRFEEALRDIHALLPRDSLADRLRVRAIVDGVLAWRDAEERRVGNRFDHGKNVAYFQARSDGS